MDSFTTFNFSNNADTTTTTFSALSRQSQWEQDMVDPMSLPTEQAYFGEEEIDGPIGSDNERSANVSWYCVIA
jgi:hypothetical protein